MRKAGPSGPAFRRCVLGTMRPMDRPPADPSKLLAQWMEFEKGSTAPGKLIANLKTGGLRELLERLAAQHEESGTAGH